MAGPAPPIGERVAAVRWDEVAGQLDQVGHALTGSLLTTAECDEIAGAFDDDRLYRSTVDMARHRFGVGTYRYFRYPLPALVDELRRGLYRPLARIAADWAERLGEVAQPEDLEEFLRACRAAGQSRPTPLVLRYERGGYNCLHQDLYGPTIFPLQVAIMLSVPDRDFLGGESVFVEQRPRAQSRGSVVRPGQGQGIVFATHARPQAGARGHHRVALRHGVSTVRAGRRLVLGIVFHDAH